ncbi:hypothetical protein MRB53_042327 [Persea americana]|nr:hypothetical protein MRB53_042327 [Persea americana]
MCCEKKYSGAIMAIFFQNGWPPFGLHPKLKSGHTPSVPVQSWAFQCGHLTHAGRWARFNEFQTCIFMCQDTRDEEYMTGIKRDENDPLKSLGGVIGSNVRSIRDERFLLVCPLQFRATFDMDHSLWLTADPPQESSQTASSSSRGQKRLPDIDLESLQTPRSIKHVELPHDWSQGLKTQSNTVSQQTENKPEPLPDLDMAELEVPDSLRDVILDLDDWD